MGAGLRRLILTMAALGGLSACGLSQVVGERTPIWTDEVLRISGPVAVIVRDAPAGEASAAFAAKLIPALPDGAALALGISYLPSDRLSATGNAILFDFAGVGPWISACADSGVPSAPSLPGATLPPARSGPTTLAAMLCQGGGAVAVATGYLDGPPDPNDPQFRTLAHDLVIVLFSRDRQNRFGSSAR